MPRRGISLERAALAPEWIWSNRTSAERQTALALRNAIQQPGISLHFPAHHLSGVLAPQGQDAAIRVPGDQRLRVLFILELQILCVDVVFHGRQLFGRAWVAPVARSRPPTAVCNGFGRARSG